MKTAKLKINSIAELKQAIKNGYTDFIILLNGGLQSTKFLHLHKGKIHIESNHTFDTFEASEDDLRYFQEAMKAGSFYAEQ